MIFKDVVSVVATFGNFDDEVMKILVINVIGVVMMFLVDVLVYVEIMLSELFVVVFFVASADKKLSDVCVVVSVTF